MVLEVLASLVWAVSAGASALRKATDWAAMRKTEGSDLKRFWLSYDFLMFLERRVNGRARKAFYT